MHLCTSLARLKSRRRIHSRMRLLTRSVHHTCHPLICTSGSDLSKCTAVKCQGNIIGCDLSAKCRRDLSHSLFIIIALSVKTYMYAGRPLAADALTDRKQRNLIKMHVVNIHTLQEKMMEAESSRYRATNVRRSSDVNTLISSLRCDCSCTVIWWILL